VEGCKNISKSENCHVAVIFCNCQPHLISQRAANGDTIDSIRIQLLYVVPILACSPKVMLVDTSSQFVKGQVGGGGGYWV
jgi:hypothetical protein